jgi:hypothetical protein
MSAGGSVNIDLMLHADVSALTAFHLPDVGGFFTILSFLLSFRE